MDILYTNSQKEIIEYYLKFGEIFKEITDTTQDERGVVYIETKDAIYSIGKRGGIKVELVKNNNLK